LPLLFSSPLPHPPPPSPHPPSLHAALPIFAICAALLLSTSARSARAEEPVPAPPLPRPAELEGRDAPEKSKDEKKPASTPPLPRSEETRLNSSHRTISYAVFCLKKKKKTKK